MWEQVDKQHALHQPLHRVAQQEARDQKPALVSLLQQEVLDHRTHHHVALAARCLAVAVRQEALDQAALLAALDQVAVELVKKIYLK